MFSYVVFNGDHEFRNALARGAQIKKIIALEFFFNFLIFLFEHKFGLSGIVLVLIQIDKGFGVRGMWETPHKYDRGRKKGGMRGGGGGVQLDSHIVVWYPTTYPNNTY